MKTADSTVAHDRAQACTDMWMSMVDTSPIYTPSVDGLIQILQERLAWVTLPESDDIGMRRKVIVLKEPERILREIYMLGDKPLKSVEDLGSGIFNRRLEHELFDDEKFAVTAMIDDATFSEILVVPKHDMSNTYDRPPIDENILEQIALGKIDSETPINQPLS